MATHNVIHVAQGPAVVYICSQVICGGLGDRLKGLVTAFWMAFLTDRAMFVHWDKPVALKEALLPNFVEWEAPEWALEQAERFMAIDRVDKLQAVLRATLEDQLPPVAALYTNRPGAELLRHVSMACFGDEAAPSGLFARTCPFEGKVVHVPVRIQRRLHLATRLRWSVSVALDLLFRPSEAMLTEIRGTIQEASPAWQMEYVVVHLCARGGVCVFDTHGPDCDMSCCQRPRRVWSHPHRFCRCPSIEV